MADEQTDISVDLVNQIMGTNPENQELGTHGDDGQPDKKEEVNTDTSAAILEGMKGLSTEYQKSLQIVVDQLAQNNKVEPAKDENTVDAFSIPGVEVSFDAGAGLQQFLESGEKDIHDSFSQRDDVISKLIAGVNAQAAQSTEVINQLRAELKAVKDLAQGSYKYADDQVLVGSGSVSTVNSPEFQEWVKEQNPVARQAYEQTVKTGSAADVKVLIDEYQKGKGDSQTGNGVTGQIQAAAAPAGGSSPLPGVDAGGITLDNLSGGKAEPAADNNLDAILADPLKVQSMFDKVAATHGREGVQKLASQLLGR